MLEREIIRNLDYNKRGWQAAKSTGRRKEKQNLEPQRTQRSTEENPKSTANQRTEGKQNLEPQRTQRSTEENPKKTRHIRGRKEKQNLELRRTQRSAEENPAERDYSRALPQDLR
jgi:hypothetical protein